MHYFPHSLDTLYTIYEGNDLAIENIPLCFILRILARMHGECFVGNLKHAIS